MFCRETETGKRRTGNGRDDKHRSLRVESKKVCFECRQSYKGAHGIWVRPEIRSRLIHTYTYMCGYVHVCICLSVCLYYCPVRECELIEAFFVLINFTRKEQALWPF